MELDSSKAEELRGVVDHAKSASPTVAVFEVQQPAKHGDFLFNFFHPDVSADVQEAIKDQLRNGENLRKLRDFWGKDYVLSHRIYPSDVIVCGGNVVSISSRNSTFSR